MNHVKILLFATLVERAGKQKSIEVTLPPAATVRDLKDRVAETYPALRASLASVIVAIDREFAFDPDVIPAGAEVALFPPVSGG